MRLLLLTDDYLPHPGGSRVYYHNLLLHLEGTETLVLTRRRAGDRDFDRAQPYRIERRRLEEAAWLRPVRLQFLPVYGGLLWSGLRAMRRFRPDVVAAGEVVPTGPVAALLAALFRRPLLLFTHAEAPATLSRTRWQSRLARWVCRRARRIVVSSGHARDLLGELWHVPEEKIEVLIPGVAEEHFDEAYLAKPCADPSRPRRILSVGRLVARKGHSIVLEALPALLERFPGLEYTIVGEGPLEGELRETVERLGLGDTVRFTGRLDPQDLLREYARSDCFALPNVDDPATGDTEGFGIVFIEAAAHGLPVVGGRTQGTQDAILDGRTGLRVDGASREAVAGAIARILGDPVLAQAFGAEGRAFAETSLRWPARAERFGQMLEQIARAASRGKTG
ncbi:MAG TPA: glycosyltransferase family 4 protein [Sumerlaeia bacterium]|nr:glycosyltransferase family 4 protein [Sumerlaeia bacterium]